MVVYITVYLVTIFFGFLLGFTFDGAAILIAGILTSLFSTYVWEDAIFANVVSFIAAGLATYLFAVKER